MLRKEMNINVWTNRVIDISRILNLHIRAFVIQELSRIGDRKDRSPIDKDRYQEIILTTAGESANTEEPGTYS
jgi:hypothetical protein